MNGCLKVFLRWRTSCPYLTLFGLWTLLLQDPLQPEQGAPSLYGVPMRDAKFPLKYCHYTDYLKLVLHL